MAGPGGARRHRPAQALSSAGRLPGPGSLWVLAGLTSPWQWGQVSTGW
jgi:hypothetical protein